MLRTTCSQKGLIGSIFPILFFLMSAQLSAQSVDLQMPDSWLVAGPFPMAVGEADPMEQAQEAFFDQEFLSPASMKGIQAGDRLKVADTKLRWQRIESQKGYSDLHNLFDDSLDYATAYIYAEVESRLAREAVLGVGSDDAMRIWLNGEEVYSHWGGRPTIPDEDLVIVQLKAGTNRVFAKVQDMQYEWGFCLREMTPDRFAGQLVEAAGVGDLDKAGLLLELGADPNQQNEHLTTALHVARMKGRMDMADLLIKGGADPTLPFTPAEEIADKVMSDMTNDSSCAMVMLIAREGEVLYRGAFGMADIEQGRKATTRTPFRIGSVTKQFVAAAILKLDEEKALSLDDRLIKYYPDWPRGDEITLKHLLTHTSGLHSFTDGVDFEKQFVNTVSPEDVEAIIRAEELSFDPGTNWYYCNSGYFLLGRIVEQVSGLTWGDFLQERFFAPLGMENTGVYKNAAPPAAEAKGYAWNEDRFEPSLNWDMDWAGGAGALYSTVEDLFLWNEELFAGEVLNAQALDAAFRPAALNDGSAADALGGRYGYGWQVSEFRDLPEISHGGGLHGWMSHLMRLPDLNATVVSLCNARPSRYLGMQELNQRLVEAFLWESLPEQTSFSSIAVPTEVLDLYVGRYLYPMGAILTVTREGDKLMAVLTGQVKNQIFPSSKRIFRWKIVDATVEFLLDDGGMATGVRHTQGGRSFEAERLEEEQPVEIDPDLLLDYAGEYTLAGQAYLIIVEDDRIFARFGEQPTMELLPRSDTEFFYKDVVASITFEKDDHGRVVALVLTQMGQNLRADRVME